MRATLRRYYGIGLDDVLAGAVSVDECWALLENAPRDSPFIAELADDPEFASSGVQGRLRLSEFSPERESLAMIYDVMAALLASVASLGGGQVPKIDPHPRPVTAAAEAAQRAEREAARAQHRDLVRRLTGGGS